MAHDPPIAEWLAAARGGDADAFGKLCEHYRGYLLAVAGRELDVDLRGKVNASDLVQDTFCDAQRGVEEFRGEEDRVVLAWLMRILRHNLTDARRAWKGAEKRDVGKEAARFSAGESGIDVSGGEPTPGTQMASAEEAARVRDILSTFPEDQREAIRLRNWELLSFEEIGARLGKSAEAARKLWARGVEKLGRELRADDGK